MASDNSNGGALDMAKHVVDAHRGAERDHRARQQSSASDARSKTNQKSERGDPRSYARGGPVKPRCGR